MNFSDHFASNGTRPSTILKRVDVVERLSVLHSNCSVSELALSKTKSRFSAELLSCTCSRFKKTFWRKRHNQTRCRCSSSFRRFFHTSEIIKKDLVGTRKFPAFGGLDKWPNDWKDTAVIHNHQSFLLAQTETSHGSTFYNMIIKHLAWNVDEAQICKKPPKKLSFVRLDSVSETHRDMNCKRLSRKDFRRVDKSRFGGLRNARCCQSNYSFGTPMGIVAWPYQNFKMI